MSPPPTSFARDGVTLHHGDALDLYATWPNPVCILSDGAYGVRGFPGDPASPSDLPAWYRPHIEAWSARATPETTLWFWNTEIGWASVHPMLAASGWEYVACHTWDKGVAHIAGNANTRTLRRFPVVTEVCVQYVKPPRFEIEGTLRSMRDWLRHEWRRSGLPWCRANPACGVRSAATRKYLAADEAWYFPPPDAFVAMAATLNAEGEPSGRPYLAVDGSVPTAAQWARMRAKFRCAFGVTNVWSLPAVRDSERLKHHGAACLHGNQKPLRLMERILDACTDEGDVLWEPFGGTSSAALVAHARRRRAESAEVQGDFFRAACERLASAPARADS